MLCFPQIVAILGMFLCVALATVTFGERLPLRRLAPIVPALLLGIGLSAPLLLHHLQMTGGHERFVPKENGVYDHLQGALLPYPLVEADLPTHWGSFDVEKIGHFYFFGGLFALLFAWQAFGFWVCWPDRRAWGRSWWIPCGIVVLLIVLGDPGFLWTGAGRIALVQVLPRLPIRFYSKSGFRAILAGGLILDRFLATLRHRPAVNPRRRASLLGVLGYHLAMCQPSFYTYGFRPYPELPPEFEAAFHPYGGQTSSIGAQQLRGGSASCWQVPLGRVGLLPVLAVEPAALLPGAQHFWLRPPCRRSAAHGRGVPPPGRRSGRRVQSLWRRLASMQLHGRADADAEQMVLGPGANRERGTAPIDLLPKRDMRVVAECHGTTLLELPDVDPLAFAVGQADRPLPMRLHCRGADIEVGGLSAGACVTINFHCYPQMKCTLDGEALEVKPDEWQRITTTLPRGGAVLALRYEPPWLQSCAASGHMLKARRIGAGWYVLRVSVIQGRQ